MKAAGRSSIATWPVSCQTTLRELGISRSNSSASRTGTSRSSRAPHDQRRAGDLAEPVADRVVGERVEGGHEARLARAAHLLGDQRAGQPIGAAGDDAEDRPPRARAARERVRPRAEPAAVQRRARCSSASSAASARSLRRYSIDSPAALTSTSRSTRCREADRQLGADEAAHRVADDARRASTPSSSSSASTERAVAGDRDLLRGHLRRAEAGQVEGDDAVRASEVRELLEPVLPGAREAVDEDDRQLGAAGAEVDHVDPGAGDADPALVLAPVDRPSTPSVRAGP